jgi:hypothetical protein
VFGALLIGLIRSGKLNGGLPLIPIICALSIAVFIAITTLLGTFFKGMMGI